MNAVNGFQVTFPLAVITVSTTVLRVRTLMSNSELQQAVSLSQHYSHQAKACDGTESQGPCVGISLRPKRLLRKS